MILGLSHLGFLPLQLSGWVLRTSLVIVRKTESRAIPTPTQIAGGIFVADEDGWLAPGSCPALLLSASTLI